jgi:hypothetical protein
VALRDRLPDRPPSLAPGFWRRFAEGAGGYLVHERFDHVAADLYSSADDPPVLPDQAERLRRLRRQQRQATSIPFTKAYERLDPIYGRVTLGTLCQDNEYCESNIVNKRRAKISDPPSTEPPRKLRVHLCWGASYAGASRSWSPAPSYPLRVTPASATQALAALLLDDWRSAFRALPLQFFLHCIRPFREVVREVRPGRRWRSRHSGSVPPSRALAALFERCDHVSVARTPNWETVVDDDERPFRRAWWCACVSSCDLGDLGFEPVADLAAHAAPGLAGRLSHAHAGRWLARAPRLPSQISHLIVVEGLTATGSLYRLDRKLAPAGGVWLQLVPERRIAIAPEGEQPSFLALRIRALDLALDELWARMR